MLSGGVRRFRDSPVLQRRFRDSSLCSKMHHHCISWLIPLVPPLLGPPTLGQFLRGGGCLCFGCFEGMFWAGVFGLAGRCGRWKTRGVGVVPFWFRVT